VMAFFRGSPEDLRRLMLEKYRCRYLVVDRWTDLRYLAGIPSVPPYLPRGTPAAIFFSTDAKTLTSAPGYRLLYRSAQPTDTMRLYELVPPEDHDAGH